MDELTASQPEKEAALMKHHSIHTCVAVLLWHLLAPAAPSWGAVPALDAACSLFKQVKVAMGGAKWDAVAAIDGEGRKTSFGLNGRFQSREDLVTGFFERRANYDIFANAEGRDENGRWRQDNSGQIHPLDSPEAVAVAVSESYLSCRGYLFPERFAATFNSRGSERDCDKLFDRLVITPKGGRALTLWIDAATHLPDRAVLELSVGSETLRFADYRAVEGILLPFKVSVEHGDESECGIAVLAAYRVSTAPPKQSLVRPTSSPADSIVRGGAEIASAPAFFDAQTGWFIVQASVNGQGPYPFILDTGGHDILTPAVAQRLGLISSGKGTSNGAGAGSTATEFTKVNKLSIGNADMVQQRFTILHIDLGMAGNDKIAGILGLEVFERFVVTLNYKATKVTLQPNEKFEYHGTGKTLPLRFTSDMPIAPATLDGQPGQFEIDTGNNTDLIVFPTWARTSGVASRARNSDKMKGTSVGGAITMAHAQAKTFEIGGLDLGGINLLLSSDRAGSLSARAEAGNVGNSVLSRFQRVTFDYRSEHLYLEK